MYVHDMQTFVEGNMEIPLNGFTVSFNCTRWNLHMGSLSLVNKMVLEILNNMYWNSCNYLGN